MDGLVAFLDTYGLTAACVVMLVKAMGVPIPIPGDVILVAVAARAADGSYDVAVAFVALLLALVLGGTTQFVLARGPARRMLYTLGPRVGLSRERLDRVATHVERGGPLGIALAVLTPGVRSAIVPACGLAGLPLRIFLAGLVLGCTADIVLHFAVGYFGAELLESTPPVVLAALVLVGISAWLLVARQRRLSRAQALQAWAQATCPICLAVGAVAPMRYAGQRDFGSGR
jgi:membrane protein DedA with SNARE-associated domain